MDGRGPGWHWKYVPNASRRPVDVRVRPEGPLQRCKPRPDPDHDVSFFPGGCGGNPGNLTQFSQDLANFLLVRGPYAYLGHGWLGCSLEYEYPAALNADYGEPTGLCAETAPASGVFVRTWTKATVQMDCNTWTPTIDMK